MADRFYTADRLGPGEYTLTGPDAHHLAHVRRFGPGDRVVLFNGDGHDYPAAVVAAGKRAVVLAVDPGVPADREVGFPIWVAAAVPKGDRADYLVEKLTELGAARLIPLATARAVVAPKGGTVDKFARAVVEASKQCGRNVLMAVDRPHTWAELLARTDLPPARVLLDPAGRPLADVGVRDGVAFAVGPEGGFTPDERDRAVAAGWAAASVGRRVLRVETAAAAAVAWAATSIGASGGRQAPV